MRKIGTEQIGPMTVNNCEKIFIAVDREAVTHGCNDVINVV